MKFKIKYNKMTEGWLREQYINQRKTTVQIAKDVGCVPSTVFVALKRLNIPVRSISEARKGMKFSSTHIVNLVKANRLIALKHCGSNHWNWKGGKKEYCRDRHSFEWKAWRKKVYERDNYTCLGCGVKGIKKNTFDPHHILPVRDFSHLKYDVNNGITLCKKCHEKTMGKEYSYVAIFRAIRKDGELLGLPERKISSQDEAGMRHKVQRLEAEARTVGNASTRPVHESDDIVCSLQECKEDLG